MKNRLENKKIEAVIFDMDGTIIDSEHLWSKAEHLVFSALGVNVTSELCKKTKSMTTSEVAKFWHEKNPWKNASIKDVENKVIDHVCFLVETEGKEKAGIKIFLKTIKDKGYKIGLATNSPYKIIQFVFDKLDIGHYFDAVSSAEHELKGKPDPTIYLTIAEKLKVNPDSCIVFEDSYSGVLSAKNAGMTVVGLVDSNNKEELKLADIVIDSFEKFDTTILH